MYCEDCGAAIEEGAHFCDSCGARLNHDVPTIPTVEAAGSQWWKPLVAVALLGLAATAGVVVYQGIESQSAAGPAPGQPASSQASPSTRGQASNASDRKSLTPDEMIETINGFCKDLDAAQTTGKVNAMEVLNYCAMHSSFQAIALASEPENLRKFYEQSLADYRLIKKRAGLNPDLTIQQMKSAKTPARVIQVLRVYRPHVTSGTNLVGRFTIRDTEYEFVGDGQMLPPEGVLGSTYAEKVSFSTQLSAATARAGYGDLVPAGFFACVVHRKPDGYGDWYHSFFSEDDQKTQELCNTLNGAIQEFNRRNVGVY